jgi:hypothetical protein
VDYGVDCGLEAAVEHAIAVRDCVRPVAKPMLGCDERLKRLERRLGIGLSAALGHETGEESRLGGGKRA